MKWSPLVLSLAVLFVTAASVEAQTSVSLVASPSLAFYGHTVTLTSQVSPPSATGTVTFYQGTRVLGTSALANGVATFATSQIYSGKRTLKARYSGDGANPPANAPAFAINVVAVAGQGFPNLQSVPGGQAPSWAAVADFNFDGKQDIVSMTYNGLQILLGNGNGTFQPPSAIGVGSNLYAVAVGDFNRDGKPDLVVSNNNPSGPSQIFILIGNGNGTFLPPVAFTTGATPQQLVVGDFNLDGNPDIAVVNAAQPDVSILLGNGDGTFKPAYTFASGSNDEGGGEALTVGDFNGDGIPDLAIAETSLIVLLGRGDGTFFLSATLGIGIDTQNNAATDVQAADLNGDGIADLAVPDLLGSTVSIYLGVGNGTFQSQTIYNTQDAPTALTLGDFNGDGSQDIAVICTGVINAVPAVINILTNAGDGIFTSSGVYNAGLYPNLLIQGDFNNDGAIDLAFPDTGSENNVPGDIGVLVAPPCAFAVSPASPLAYDSNGGAPTFSLTTTNSACGWQAVSSVNWALPGTPSGVGNATIHATVQANGTGVDRTGTLLIGSVSIPVTEDATTQVFTDTPPGSYYFDAVNLLSQKAITQGCGTNLFCPTYDTTRDQMAVFIVRAVLGTDNFSYNPVPYFTDVQPSTFGFQWIQKLYEMGITTGCGPSLFCPTGQVTRDQMAVFIIRARYGATTNFNPPTTPYFADVTPQTFGFAWIQKMAQDVITTGCQPTLYCPTGPVTRGDMAVFVMRGAFNQLLPLSEPILTSVNPRTLAPGTTGTFTVTALNTNFVQNTTTVLPVGGATIQSVTVTSPTSLSVTLTAPGTPLAQPIALWVATGAQQAVFPNAIAIQ